MGLNHVLWECWSESRGGYEGWDMRVQGTVGQAANLKTTMRKGLSWRSRDLKEVSELSRHPWRGAIQTEGTAVLPSFKEQQGSHCSCRELRISDFCPKCSPGFPFLSKILEAASTVLETLPLLASWFRLLPVPLSSWRLWTTLEQNYLRKKAFLSSQMQASHFLDCTFNNEHHSVMALVTGCPEDCTERKMLRTADV